MFFDNNYRTNINQADDVVSKGATPTYLKKHKISKWETVAQSLKEQFDYEQNPDRMQGGELMSVYECNYITADGRVPALQGQVQDCRGTGAAARCRCAGQGQVCLCRRHPHRPLAYS